MLCEARRDEAAAHWAFAPQIDRLDMRHMLAAEPRRQHHALIAPLAGIDFGLDRWGRRRTHDRNFRDVRTHHRHVAGVIMRALVLLVGLIVLFIDYDQSK